MVDEKLIPLDRLADCVSQLKASGRSIVLCHGTFDLMHAGHIRHLHRAREEGDVLVVTVTSDQYVNKGPGRPVFHETLRAESIAALGCVCYVSINTAPTAINVIELIKPDLYVKGGEYREESSDVTGNITHERNSVEAYGGQVFFTDEVTFSSSNLLNEHFGLFPEETKNYLDNFRLKYGADEIIEAVKSLNNLNVLVVGDAIVDEYHYTQTLGQTGKGNVLAVKYRAEEQFAGGSLAVANHISGFVENVTLVAGLGRLESHESFIRSKLSANIAPVFFMRDDSQTLVKRRFVDADMAKLFEVYFYSDDPLPESIEDEVQCWLNQYIDDYDLVVVPDFGNGFITEKMAKSLSERSKSIVVNTQVNSGNRGYHVIGRYPHVDFVSLNEPELRLATHNRSAPLSTLAKQVAKQVGAKWIAVTRGTKGLLILDIEKDIESIIPPLSTKVVDRVGAGDAFLSIAGICLERGIGVDVAGFLGSAAAALEVQEVCNREPVTQMAICKYITTLLK